jgi:7,8-dihydropterin-6-yl-methyl-4-(beta-D-ribofuranosyl)aminobenzene 5'-phosphate synthase
MKIVSLMDNVSGKEEIGYEHGLSFYIETGRYKLLFDTGAGDLFWENARKLNIDLKDIDYAVISHGHYDHGGGLRRFLAENSKADVFVKKKAFDKHYSRRPDGDTKDIGLDRELKDNKHLVFTGERFFITTGIELFSNVAERDLYTPSNRNLLVETEEGLIEDMFEHEQNLIVTEKGKRVLFMGCAHNGIVKILNLFSEIKLNKPDYVFGGFHLSSPSAGEYETEYIEQLGKYLN